RLAPLSPATVSYLLGAAGVRFPRFLVACVGLTPHLVLEVFFGHAGRHLASLLSRPGPNAHLEDALLLAGLAIGVVLLVGFSRGALRSVQRAVEGAGAVGAGGDRGRPRA
ncbi:MAG: hypothetical protein KDD11_07825, partial [Acidobacteria bacterium]|nr:hypothetical protein [Acidobacteriota bacterium]